VVRVRQTAQGEECQICWWNLVLYTVYC